MMMDGNNMFNGNDMFMRFGSFLATIMFVRAMFNQVFPYEWREAIQAYILRHSGKFVRVLSPYLHITFDEYTGEWFDKSKFYGMIETYLSGKTSDKARGLKATSVEGGKTLVLGLGDNEEVTDVYEGVKVWWSYCTYSRGQNASYYPGMDEKRYYKLKFHSRHRDLITQSYLRHVFDQGKAITIARRQRKLYTNVKDGSYSSRLWSHVDFKHPASFGTLAMEPSKKQSIITDLLRFRAAKDYYAKIGKPWKRGYLLYGPPGTGKSTMIAAMANLMEYDVYDLELTSVSDNTQLRRLLIQTTSKSIIVIEDIDCSLDLTSQRSKKKEQDEKEKEGDKDEAKKLKELEGEKKSSSAVTLSGLLNFIDGIWSACGEERLIVFTTNFLDKLDPALIRRGRMDVHIELAYCGFEAFKELAKNYLGIESHERFDTVKRLLEETKMTPADVAENLMPKTLELDVEESLENLIKALEESKEKDKLKAKEEEREKENAAKLKAEEEENAAKLKAEEEKKLKEKEATDGKAKDDGNANKEE